MLRFFYLNKLRYEKGQLAPVFIAVLAIILIMTLVTVNLSKVSLTKTETSNAVDAGALACASSMASVFNGIAASNSQLEVSYWESFAVISASFVIALYYAIMATIFAVVAHIIADAGVFMVLAICFITICNGCSSVVDAIKNAVTTAVAGVLLAVAAFIMESWVAPRLTRLILTMASIIIGVSALHIAQHFFFLNIKRQAMKGRKEALKLGYRIAFKNSGIAGKLRDDTPVVENSLELIRALLASGASFTLNSLNQAENYEYDFDDEENHSLLQLLNSQNSFSLFMSTLRHWPLYIYPWQDGQGRGHLVVVTQKTMDVNNYILHSTLLPFPAEMALLSTALGLAIAARVLATSTTTAYSAASGSYLSAAVTFATAAIALAVCCIIPATCPAACADYEAAYGLAIAGNTSGMTGTATNTSLISLLIAFYPVLGASYVGLLPGYSVPSSVSSMHIITWIDDIIHDRKVYFSSLQQHQGKSLEQGFYRTRYPNVHSYSVGQWKGGSIHTNPSYDSSLFMTDHLFWFGENSGSAEGACAMAESDVRTWLQELEVLLTQTNLTQPQVEAILSETYGGASETFGDTSSDDPISSGDYNDAVASLADETEQLQQQIAELRERIHNRIVENPGCNFPEEE